jgi:predicted dehydrogenase
MVRGAIIGLGNVAVHGHLPGWLSRLDVEIVAATDTHPARRAECAARLPDARWWDSAEALLADAELDFVDICTPPSSHATLIRQALERGRHVLCEKPLVGSLEELRAVVELAADTGRIVHTVHNWHHAPIVRRTSELVGDGAIGHVTHAAWRTLRTRPAVAAVDGDNWRLDPLIAGGGILTDHGWHVCYLVPRWLGAAPTALSARLETRRHTRSAVEDTATLRLRFPHAIADLFLTWAADERGNWAQLTGTNGTIEVQDSTLVLKRSGAEQRWAFASGLSDGSHHPEWFRAVADQFLADMTGRATEDTNLAEASLCVAVETVARESGRRDGEELSIPVWPSPRPMRPERSR